MGTVPLYLEVASGKSLSKQGYTSICFEKSVTGLAGIGWTDQSAKREGVGREKLEGKFHFPRQDEGK